MKDAHLRFIIGTLGNFQGAMLTQLTVARLTVNQGRKYGPYPRCDGRICRLTAVRSWQPGTRRIIGKTYAALLQSLCNNWELPIISSIFIRYKNSVGSHVHQDGFYTSYDRTIANVKCRSGQLFGNTGKS